MPFVISRHAKEEIERRQIPLSLLQALLKNPQQRIPQSGGKVVFQSRMASEQGKMFLLRAVVATDREPPVVVTAYRTSRIEKYWRPE
jgi:hypothetical protein